MTVHEKPVGATVEWYTPPELFDALGLDLDLDPAAPANLPHWIPASTWYSADGQHKPWAGRVWLNPPYGRDLPAFVARMVEHRHGLMLTAARTETAWWQSAIKSADAVAFLRDRPHFIRDDGYQARSSFGSTIFAFGDDCAHALWAARLGVTVTRHPVVAPVVLEEAS